MDGLFLMCQWPSDFVDTVCASWRLPPLAAAFNSDTASFLEKIKETAALIFQKPPRQKGRVKIPLLYDGFFSFAVVRQFSIWFVYYRLNKFVIKLDVLQTLYGKPKCQLPCMSFPLFNEINKKAELITMSKQLMRYRLCVCASGSLPLFGFSDDSYT